MDLPHKHKTQRLGSRRGCHCRNLNFYILILLGLWISNTIIGCAALPHPKPPTTSATATNSISKRDHANDYDNNENVAVALGAPLIIPLMEEVQLEENSEYTIRCEDTEPIAWKYPFDAITVEENSYIPQDQKRRYGSSLTLKDVNYMNVANYYCVKTSALTKDLNVMEDSELTDLANSNLASAIYVYVNDKNNLLAPMAFPVTYVIQFQDAVIPCKPSMPNYDVILTTPSGSTFASNTGIRYNPRLGFVIEILGFEDSGMYICRPKIPAPANEEEQTEIEIILGNKIIDTYTTHVDKPNITSNAKHHAPEGGTFELICDVKIAHDVKYKIEWVLPDGVQRDETRFVEKSYPNFNVTDTHVYSRNILTVKNAKTTDSGHYTCNVSDHSSNKAKSSYNMLIVRKDESYIKMRESNDYYKINEKANKTVQMSVRYSGYPWPKIKWYNPNGTEIFNNHKFEINTDDVSSTLKIYSSRLWDTGVYVVEASNSETSLKRDFLVTIEDTPIITMNDIYVHADEKAHVQCRVQSHQKALVSWVFEPCSIVPRWPSCSREVMQDFNETFSSDGPTPIEFIYDLYFQPKSPGIIRCAAMNKIGKAVAKSHVLIRDINDNITIYGVQDNDIIALGDKITLTCAAVAYYFSGDIDWYDEKGNLIEETNNIVIHNSSTPYSYQKSLTFKKIRDSDQGQYECRARAINHESTESRIFTIITHEPSSPHMVATNLGDKIERKLGDSVELRCEAEAIPKALVEWYKNEELLENNDTDNQAVLVIPYLRPEDQGQYKCKVSNRLGSIEETVNIKITNIPGPTLGWIAGIIVLLLVLIGLVIYLYMRVKRERKLLRELKAAGLANFEEGAIEHINPALTLDEQADLLPYDRGFEFPREKLKLGKQLGAGAFGVVLKAHAEGIKPDEKESVVAVKMVKRQANNEVMRALVSELKIMVHLGQHLNVVNLLGAVTKNIAKRELMVIVEYCRYGNVQNFLMRNRKRFINQINPNTGKIDPSIMTQRFSDNFELNRNSDNDPRSGTRAGRPNSTGYITQSEYEGQVNTCATEQTVMTTVPEDDDNNIMSNNSVQPAWRSNYKPDSTEAMAVTTTDLISWAFQVACGMEYLSSKKVLHGDLAARNILLCEDNIVKICDFGLARSMYKSDNYKKQGDAPLPIKWLALESLSDHIFSTYTDVWSYGIVLWELFSLAKVPYPEIDANQSLYLKLKDGYRMEKPPYANDDLYDIMLECWSTNPERRPLFNVLKERFALMLGEEVTSHYVDLNEPYLRVNTEYLKRNQTDYLSLMGSPDEMAPPPPRYVNGHVLPEIRIDLSTDDYLTMSPNGDAVIFSPTRPKDSPKTSEDNDSNTEQANNISASTFNFPDTAATQQHSPTIINNLDSPVNKPPRNKKEGIEPLPEEIPMLQNNHHSEDSPEQPRKYAQMLQQTRNVPTPSPRHHVTETKLHGENGDNYVNIKSPKKFINNNGSKAPDAFSNPSYQILKTAGGGSSGGGGGGVAETK